MAGCFLIVLFALVYGGLSATVLPLHRAVPTGHPVQLDHLQARDRVRHAWLFKDIVAGIINVSVAYQDPLLYPQHIGLFLTTVKLGSPPKEFKVFIDTGSDVLWIACSSCTGCPRSSGIGVQINSYDYANSSTGGLIYCSHPVCTSKCSHKSNPCTYSFGYNDGSQTSGYFVVDELHFDMIPGQSQIGSSASVVFGCTTYVSRLLTDTSCAFNGIFGFGQGPLSLISQLSSRGITPPVFSHCLKGDGDAGGILVLGEIVEPSIVYSPLVQSKHSYYSIQLQSITVNGQILPIDRAAFTHGRRTVVDSGTSLAYITEEAYYPFVDAITFASKSVTPIISDRRQCYLLSTSLAEAFPPVNLNFAAGASMSLKPQEYLIYYGYFNSTAMWCIGFMKANTPGLTILGDLFIKDKIVVYDLARQRLGWANYNCSLPVNVSIDMHRRKRSSSSGDMQFGLLTTVAVLMIYFYLN